MGTMQTGRWSQSWPRDRIHSLGHGSASTDQRQRWRAALAGAALRSARTDGNRVLPGRPALSVGYVWARARLRGLSTSAWAGGDRVPRRGSRLLGQHRLDAFLELIGTSTESWERAASAAVERAAETLRDLRVAEVVEQDMQISDGKVEAFRVKLKVSFKYGDSDED